MRMPDSTHVQNHAIARRGCTGGTRLSSFSSDANSSGVSKGLFTMEVTRRAKATAVTLAVKTEVGRPPSLRVNSWPDELQHEFIYRHLRAKYDRVARVLAMAQEVPFSREPESRRLDFPPQRRFFDAMQGFRDAYARTRLSGMVGDHQRAAGFEGSEQRAIHLCAVDAHERRVVIGEKEGDEIEIAHARWNRIVIVSQHAHDVPHRRRFRALVEAFSCSR